MASQSETVRTIGFVDLAGFTALTEAHGDAEAADLVGRFCGLASRQATEGDQVVKSIGDAVMTASKGPAAGVRFMAAIMRACLQETLFPVARGGLHHGPVVARDGDYFGATVNLAARVAGQAEGGQLLATTAVVEGADAAGPWIDLGTFHLRNVRDPVHLHELQMAGEDGDAAVDPVCRMLVPRATATGRLRHDRVDYWLCSLQCAARFAAEPDRYAT